MDFYGYGYKSASFGSVTANDKHWPHMSIIFLVDELVYLSGRLLDTLSQPWS